MYRITPQGCLFVEGKMQIRDRIMLYHNAVHGMSGELQWISDFWPDFDYEELMKS
jgi:hypothetical protein